MQQNIATEPFVKCTVATEAGIGRVEYQIEIADKVYRVFFDSPRAPLSGSVEAAVCMSVLGAMRQGLQIVIDDPVSRTFLINQQQLVSIFTGWFAQYKRPEWHAKLIRKAHASGATRVGSFFTGGVDSFYTFLKNKSDITDLIYVHGYDVRLEDTQKRLAISAMGAAVERETGVRFIEIETNAVRLFKDYGKWGLHGHGYGLGTIVRLLEGYLERIYIPSSFAEAELMPWASHPATDVLFSDEAVTVIHDGCEAARTQKLQSIANSAMALQHLRVCWEKLEGAYNCGRCEKCLRTMTTLYGLGLLSKATTFPEVLSVSAIRGLLLDSESARTFAAENIRFLDDMGFREDPVRAAWIHAANRPAWKLALIRRSRRTWKKFLRQWKKITT